MDDLLAKLTAQKRAERQAWIGTQPSGLQTIAESLKASSAEGETISSDMPIAQQYPDYPEPVPCEFCGKLRYFEGPILQGRIRWSHTPKKCGCKGEQEHDYKIEIAQKSAEEARRKAEEEAAQREVVAKLIGQSGMGSRFYDRTFENMDETKENRTAIKEGKAFLKDFGTQRNKNSLLIFGPVGTGKTHLAAAIANELMAQGKAVVFRTASEVLKSLFDSKDGRILELYKTAPLLVLDDVGKETPSDWAVSKIEEIVNSRNENYMPIIITSNYSPQELAQRFASRDAEPQTVAALMDRLVGMCQVVKMEGKSWRGREVT